MNFSNMSFITTKIYETFTKVKKIPAETKLSMTSEDISFEITNSEINEDPITDNQNKYQIMAADVPSQIDESDAIKIQHFGAKDHFVL